MPFTFTRLEIPDIILIEPKVFGDERGFFIETYQTSSFAEAGIPQAFVQDNHSMSHRGVLRGMHYQLPPFDQGKLVRVTAGSVLDVAVDLRKNSPWYGKHVSMELSKSNKRILWIPSGFAHGFQTLENDTEFIYKVTKEYNASMERGVSCDDSTLGIHWPIAVSESNRSARDCSLPVLSSAENPFVYSGNDR